MLSSPTFVSLLEGVSNHVLERRLLATTGFQKGSIALKPVMNFHARDVAILSVKYWLCYLITE